MGRHARKVRALARRAPEPRDQPALGPAGPIGIERPTRAVVMTAAAGEASQPVGRGGRPIGRAVLAEAEIDRVLPRATIRLPGHLAAGKVTGAVEQTVPIGAPAVG